MSRRHSKAAITDRRAASVEMTMNDILQSSDADRDESEYSKASATSIQEIRPYFDGRSLRRTLCSKGFEDSMILNMPDPCEVVVLLALHPHEVEVLELAAEDALENSKTDVWWRSVRICFHSIRVSY